jgi:hypothetical protein
MSRFYQVQTHSQSLLLGTLVLNFYSRLRPFWLLVNLAGGRVAGQNVLSKAMRSSRAERCANFYFRRFALAGLGLRRTTLLQLIKQFTPDGASKIEPLPGAK